MMPAQKVLTVSDYNSAAEAVQQRCHSNAHSVIDKSD